MLQVRIDDDLKNEASALFNELGIDLSTAVRIFLRKSIAVGGLPFEMNISKTSLKGFAALEKMREISEKNGNSEMTLDEINKEIAKSRKEID